MTTCHWLNGLVFSAGQGGVLAYIDPGASSYLFQILIAGLTALMFLFRRTPAAGSPPAAGSGKSPDVPGVAVGALPQPADDGGTPVPEPASFRDPSGTVIRQGGLVLRVVNASYREHYEHLLRSGLYAELVEQGLLLPHRERGTNPAGYEDAYKTLEPRQLPFISYPYEWSFHQLRDAALATLRIQRIALDHGMSLKDASAFNLQFVDGAPVLIDTLSFETLRPSQPWTAYRQFCQHFLAPLALMRYRDPRLGWLSRVCLDGVPVELAAALLPHRSRLRLGLLLHLHLHGSGLLAALSRRRPAIPRPGSYSLRALRGLVQSLESAVEHLERLPRHVTRRSPWHDYYGQDAVTGADYLTAKEGLVAAMLDRVRPAAVWDLGANTGRFARLAAERHIPTWAFDADHDCVDACYLRGRRERERFLLPLWLDLTNPSPALGWEHTERQAWMERGRPELVMALALVHHLALGNNLPLARLASFCRQLAPWLLIEFVPKDDPNAQRLLTLKGDIFPDYTQTAFERVFTHDFTLEAALPISGSQRVLYLMRRREARIS